MLAITHQTRARALSPRGWQWMLHTWIIVSILTTFFEPHLLHAAEFTVAAGDVAGLIEAITLANANGEDDIINLASGPYTLTAVHSDTNGPNGLPSITSVITIRGPEPDGAIPYDPATIERDPTAPSFRLLHVSASGRLTLNDLEIGDRVADPDTGVEVNRGGVAVDGGGLWSAGTVTLFRSKVRGNAARQGGGVFNSGSLTVNTSVIDSNQAVADAQGGGVGGGIMNRGRVVISNSAAITRNAATNRGGGLANDSGATVQLTNSSFAGNFASAVNGAGGGLQNNGTVTLTNCFFAANAGWFGGGLQNTGGSVQLRNCILSRDPTLGLPGNQAFNGGAIHNSAGGRVTLLLTAIAENTALNPNGMGGGGIWNAAPGSTVSIMLYSQVTNNTPNNCTGVAC